MRLAFKTWTDMAYTHDEVSTSNQRGPYTLVMILDSAFQLHQSGRLQQGKKPTAGENAPALRFDAPYTTFFNSVFKHCRWLSC